jgi:hypothetical protein
MGRYLVVFSWRYSRAIVSILAFLLLVGCAAQAHREEMGQFSEAWVVGDFQTAALGGKRSEEVTEQDIQRMDLLQLLNSGEALRLAGEDQLALDLFDQTEETFRRFDEQNFGGRAAGQVAAVLLNESVREYRGNLYEAILVNAYKSLVFLGQAQPEMARVELNRADDRTRRAVEFFAAEILAEQQALRQDQNQNAQSVSRTLQNNDTQTRVYGAVGNPSQWSVYPDFINPFVTYLHGLFFLAQSRDDIERSRQSFERVAGMTENRFVREDLALAEQLARGSLSRSDVPPMVWVILENGNGPTLSEVRIDIPIWLYTEGRPNRPTLGAIALPKVENGRAVVRRLSVSTNQANGSDSTYQTELLADMGRVVNTEFQRSFNGILTRSLASAVVNMALQAEMSDRAGLLGAIAATAFTASTTHADLRIWRALPAEWNLVRFERPKSGHVQLTTEMNRELASLELPDWPYTLIYLKQTGPTANPVIRVIDLTGRHPAINPNVTVGNSSSNSRGVGLGNVANQAPSASQMVSNSDTQHQNLATQAAVSNVSQNRVREQRRTASNPSASDIDFDCTPLAISREVDWLAPGDTRNVIVRWSVTAGPGTENLRPSNIQIEGSIPPEATQQLSRAVTDMRCNLLQSGRIQSVFTRQERFELAMSVPFRSPTSDVEPETSAPASGSQQAATSQPEEPAQDFNPIEQHVSLQVIIDGEIVTGRACRVSASGDELGFPKNRESGEFFVVPRTMTSNMLTASCEVMPHVILSQSITRDITTGLFPFTLQIQITAEQNSELRAASAAEINRLEEQLAEELANQRRQDNQAQQEREAQRQQTLEALQSQDLEQIERVASEEHEAVMTDALVLLRTAQSPLLDYYEKHARWPVAFSGPHSLAALLDRFSSEHAFNLRLIQSSTTPFESVTVSITLYNSSIEGDLSLAYDGRVKKWTCFSTDIPEQFLPAECGIEKPTFPAPTSVFDL